MDGRITEVFNKEQKKKHRGLPGLQHLDSWTIRRYKPSIIILI